MRAMKQSSFLAASETIGGLRVTHSLVLLLLAALLLGYLAGLFLATILLVKLTHELLVVSVGLDLRREKERERERGDV
jgi:hypothetical protein